MFSKNIFSERVRALRIGKKITQSDLAEILNLSVQAVNDIEKGRRTTTFESLYIMSNYFEVSTDYLLGLTDDPTRH